MKRCLLILTLILACCLPESRAQSGLKQYFDGADTVASQALLIVRDTAAGNIWQIGKPQKNIFGSAATVPNAIVTDTIHAYPPSDTSRFTIKFKDSGLLGHTPIIAVRWKQKLDMQSHHSGGVVEFSKNGGAWQNAFNNTANVYNFYGYLQANKDTLPDGTYVFSGTDTVWRDIWFCMKSSPADSFAVRYSLLTDTTAAGKEGWMIDNMLVQRTFIHTVAQVENKRDSKVYPTATTGIIFVEAAHLQQQHFIKSVSITDATGKIVRRYTDEQSRYVIDISTCPSGEYFVKVITNLGSETFPVMLHN